MICLKSSSVGTGMYFLTSFFRIVMHVSFTIWLTVDAPIRKLNASERNEDLVAICLKQKIIIKVYSHYNACLKRLWLLIYVFFSTHAGTVIKTKWKSIKDRFRKEVNKIPKCKSDAEDPNPSSLLAGNIFHYSFLKDVFLLGEEVGIIDVSDESQISVAETQLSLASEN